MNVEIIATTTHPFYTIYSACCQCTGITPYLGSQTEFAHHAIKIVHKAINSGHLSVLEHASLTFRILDISRACSHQLVRHRLASYSQLSQRYALMEDTNIVIPESIEKDPLLSIKYKDACSNMYKLYNELIKREIPKEDARYLLPEATSTRLITTMNCRELLHFFEERLCNKAQWEIRELANKMLVLCKEYIPIVFDNAGPKCLKLKYCPESKPCGQKPYAQDTRNV